jgi:hypothetical protein
MSKLIAFSALLAMAILLVPGTSHARYLNTGAGRFQTMDTYEGDNEDPLSLHKYLYAEDNPVDNVDPSGHDISEMLAVMDVFSSLFATISPVTSTAATTTGVAGRPLTQGEINLATLMFGSKINNSAVKIYHHTYLPFLPDKNSLMTPNGNIYASKNSTMYSSDYSTMSPPAYATWPLIYPQAVFVHEMTHVWQYQHGMWVKTRRVTGSWNYDYDFATFGTKDFKSYGIEEEAQIVEDFYLLLHGGQIYRNGSPVSSHPPAQTYQIVTGKYFP